MEENAIEQLWKQHFANWSITGKGIPVHILERRLRFRLAGGAGQARARPTRGAAAAGDAGTPAMALALTDAQMCLVLIRCTGLKVTQQRELLRLLARQANLKYAASEKQSRQRAYYHRKKKGLVVIRFEADPDDAAQFLREVGIRVTGEDGKSLSTAFSELLPRWLYGGLRAADDDFHR